MPDDLGSSYADVVLHWLSTNNYLQYESQDHKNLCIAKDFKNKFSDSNKFDEKHLLKVTPELMVVGEEVKQILF